MNVRRTLILASLPVALCATLSACGTARVPGTGIVTTNPAASASAAAPTLPIPTTARLGTTDVVTLGLLTLTTGPPTRFTPGPFTVGIDAGDQTIKFRLTIRNGSTEPFDATYVPATAAFGPDGIQGEPAMDNANVPDSTGSVIPAGSSASVTFAFAIPSGVSLTKIDVVVSLGGDSVAIFQGGIQ